MIIGFSHRSDFKRLAPLVASCFLVAALLLTRMGRAATSQPSVAIGHLARLLVAPVHPPDQPPVQVIRQSIPDCVQAIRVPVGPPPAVLAVAEVYPRKSPWCFARTASKSQLAHQWTKTDFRIRGTVLLLPGYGLSKATLVPYAKALAKRDYLSVLVDLRAQGKSTGHHVGYGKQEAKDLVQLLHTLGKHGMIKRPLGILGISYGAAVALDTAAIDGQIDAVVAVAPFARAFSVVRRFVRVTDPELADQISRSLLRSVIQQAGKLLGYPLSESDPIRWVPDIRAHVLYLAGNKDHIAPVRDIQQLVSQTPCAKIVVVSGANHVVLSFDTRLIEEKTFSWFHYYMRNRHLCHPATSY